MIGKKIVVTKKTEIAKIRLNWLVGTPLLVSVGVFYFEQSASIFGCWIMIFDTSYPDKETKKIIDSTVGESFSFKERWKMGGIGSPRMVIEQISEEYKQYMNPDHYRSNANIELRPKGILIHFRHKLQVYTWVMPYGEVAIHFEGNLTLSSEGKFIEFSEGINEKFVQKMIKLAASKK